LTRRAWLQKLLYLDEPGCGLSAKGEHLIVKAPPIEMGFKPREHRLQCVILAARGFVTIDALAWLAREHVAVIIVHEGEFLTLVNATAGRLARGEIALRRRQMECVLDPARRLATARSLVAVKIKTLELEPKLAGKLSGKVAKARSIEEAMAVEAEAGSTYWRARQGSPMAFKDGTAIEFDTRARAWKTGRLGETGKQFSNRFALDPPNAMINYAGAIIVAQCTRALTGLGCDVAFGVLHSTRPGMAALAWDVFELLRARTETAVFRFAGSRKFDAKEFKLERESRICDLVRQ
jgi:CRISPR-associated endonuclease Cas1